MRVRLGVPDDAVFGGSGLSVRKAQMAIKDTATKVKEGANFFIVGIKLLGSDIGYASKLFARAAFFNTLKPREVSVRSFFHPLEISNLLVAPFSSSFSQILACWNLYSVVVSTSCAWTVHASQAGGAHVDS